MRHHVYYEGRVQSLGFADGDGEKTVGVISPGEYAFAATRAEAVTVISGGLWYRVPGKPWLSAGPGEPFSVAAGVSFEVKAEGPVSYLCRYGGVAAGGRECDCLDSSPERRNIL